MFSISNNQFPTLRHLVTTDEVEKYVGKVQSRLQSPLEKKSKAFAFARLYYDARDYGTAKKYLEDYLSIQDRDFRVYNLMGQCEEALGNNDGALSAYKRSLELCSTQNDIVVKVISLCIKCPIDPLRAKLWADKGSRICPGHPVVFDLKWHLLELQETKDYEEMELLLADELARRAREPSLHIKLVKLYMEAGSHKRAFLHCQSVQKTGAFDDDMAWLECSCDVFDYHRQSKEAGKTSASLIFALTLCKLMKLHLKNSLTRVCLPILNRFDKTVKELISHGPLDIFDGLTPEWKDCISEMKGQLYLNTAIYLLKLAQENIISWTKAKRMTVALLMACWQIEISQPTSKLLSQHSLLKQYSSQSYNWSTLACMRLSHTGHLLLYLEGLYDTKWLKNCIFDFCTDQGHAALLDNIYPEKVDAGESFLAKDDDFKQMECKMPDIKDLLKFDEVTVSQHATDLHQIIWIALQWDILHEKMKPGVGVIVARLFEGISLDVKNMNNCHHSSLCLRDIEAFIYSVIRSSKNIHLECNTSEEALELSHPLICSSLVTEQQKNWWQAAYGLYTGKSGTQSISKLKSIMQKGLETIRCLQNHGIDPRILIYVSFAFWEKGLSIESSRKEECDYKDHWQSLQKRAMHYMKEALRILEIFRANKTMPFIEHPLILPLSPPLEQEEISLLLNKNYMKLAESAMLGGDLKEALQYYEEVKSLQSFYSQSQIYIRLASGIDQKSLQGEKDHLYYIKKAKEKLSVCIQNADHSPEFKQSLINQLHEIESTNASKSHSVIPTVKKALNFEVNEIPDAADVGIDETLMFSNDELPPKEGGNVLQEQLDAKESEIKSLKQALAMYKAHIDMQKHYQAVQPVLNSKPIILPQFPPNAQHRHIRSLDSTTSNTVTPVVQNEIGTPSALGGGLETPSDMWWDSFSPQPSFEKGYFAGLAEHAQQSREEKGEGEAPTLKDTLDEPSLEQQADISLQNQPSLNGSLTPTKEILVPNQSSSPAPVVKESPKTPTSPAYEGADIYVEPIVHLSSKSDIVTGEEDEIVKFVHRAKLYRFDKEAGQWKERGIGDVKILYNDTSNKYRITMRREQVFRVCCNHFITQEMSLESKVGSKAAWSWFTAADATDDESRPEQFTIKFKMQETADEFRNAFIECQQALKKKPVFSPPKSEIETANESVQVSTITSLVNTFLTSTSSPLVNPFLTATSSFSTPALSTATQEEEISSSFQTYQANEAYDVTDGGFQFTFGSQEQTNIPGATPYSFNGFTFQPKATEGQSMQASMGTLQVVNETNDLSVVSESIQSPAVVFTPQSAIPPADQFQTVNTLPPEVPGLTPSPFSGFSFSNKTTENIVSPSIPPSEVNEAMTTDYPMMASLLKGSAVPNPPLTPQKPTIIEGMTKLPVFEKGLVDASIDPSSFWTSASPEKPFFTGNSVGLEAIGHKEESGEVIEDKNIVTKYPQEVYQGEQDMYAYEMYDSYEYYGENGEYYDDGEYYYDSANDEYDDQDGEYVYQHDNQPSRASSSRRGSGDDDLQQVIDDERPVEDRFDIQKKVPNINIIDVIDDDLVITSEKVPTFAQKLKASRLQLPTTFFLYESKPACTGCRGCIDNFDNQPSTVVEVVEPVITSLAPSLAPTTISTLFGGSKEDKEISFASLASSGTSDFSSSGSGLFSGAGVQLFSPSTSEKKEGEVDNCHDPHYDAIVQLQKVEKIETGEEDEEVVFKHRAKLYRFDEKWRERGIGDIKLTKGKTTGYCRVLMRRDLIHKLCANHAVMPKMELKPLHTSDSSLVWFTPSDYSEGAPPVPQQFCVKFKNKEIADEFTEKFNMCKQVMEETLKAEEKKSSDSTQSVKDAHAINTSSDSQVASSQRADTVITNYKGSKQPLDFKIKFAPKAGSWECNTCMIQNEPGTSKCVACETPIPNLQANIGMPKKALPDFKSKFAPKAGSWECNTCMVQNEPGMSKCVACETPNSNLQANVGKEALPDFLRNKFAPKAGSWECNTCMVQNEPGMSKCVACETQNPNYKEETPDKGFTFGATSQPSFGLPSSNQLPGFTFNSMTNTSVSSFSFGMKPETATTPVFSFGMKPEATTPVLSFGTKPEVTTPPVFSFGMKPEATTNVAFSFGTKQDSITSSTSTIDSKPEMTSASPFSFGANNTPASTTPSFSFGTQSGVSSAGFSFGTKPPLGQSPSLNISWGNTDSTPEKNREKIVDASKFEADPHTWECPSCLAKNDGYREICRQCEVPKEKTPVVKLDPLQFSTPVNLQVKNNHSQILHSPGTIAPALVNPALQLNFDSFKPNSSAPFNWASSPVKADSINANKERDKELMPPPKGLPIFSKTSPKQDEKKGITKVENKVESSSSWVPQGLNLSNLFSFGTTPSPSLSNASSVDDLSQTGTISVPSAFAGTAFTFQFEPPVAEPATPKQSENIDAAPKSPTSPNEYYEDDDANNSIEFTPLVSIAKVEHTSGEEEEECIFTARSKMFRFDGQWKERGVGEIKILLHTINNQYRLIMRRDQTHKLCANHSLLNGMTIKPMQGAKKAYVWKTGADISDGDSVEQMFAARFKDEEISDEFRDVFSRCCSEQYTSASNDVEVISRPKVIHDVIEILDSEDEDTKEEESVPVVSEEISLQYEPNVNADLKLKAKELLLPNSFYHVPTIELCSKKDGVTDENVQVNGVQSLQGDGQVLITEIPQLTLTHEKIPNLSMEQRSDKMLLPKGFYNYEENANLTDENIEVIDDEPIVNLDYIYEKMEYPSFQIDESAKIIFDEPCSVFRMSSATNDYMKLSDGVVKLKEHITSKNLTIVLVSENKIYLQIDVTTDTTLVMRADSKNTYDIEAVNMALSIDNTLEKFTLKFKDLLTCEKFSSLIEESKSPRNSDKVSELAAVGSHIFGSANGTASASQFGSLVSNEPSGFEDNSGHSFQGAGKTLFGGNKESNGDAHEVSEGDIYVEPIVQLETIKTSSGEEGEWVTFNQRCKLYVFDNTSKKWKERGVGEIKLLQDKNTYDGRVVMRRDQVHKLCANHMLLPNSKLEPFKGKELTVTWNAIGDVSNGPPEDCILACRFKNETILDEFKTKFSALCRREQVEPLTKDEEGSDVLPPVLHGSCDLVLTKSLSDVKI